MQAISLSDIRAAIKDRAEIPTLTTTTFITLAQMDRWINQSGKRLMEMLIAAHGEGHWGTSQALTVTVDQQYSVLPVDANAALTDIYRVLYLRVTLDGTRIEMVRGEAEFVDMEDDNDTVAWTLAFPPRWHFREGLDQRFLWSRTPTTAHVVTVHYVPYFVFIDLTTPSTPVGIPAMLGANADDHYMRSHMGWDEWLILDCAIKAYARQDMDPPALLLKEHADMTAQINTAAKKRTDEAKRVRRRFFQQDQIQRRGSRNFGW